MFYRRHKYLCIGLIIIHIHRGSFQDYENIPKSIECVKVTLISLFCRTAHLERQFLGGQYCW